MNNWEGEGGLRKRREKHRETRISLTFEALFILFLYYMYNTSNNIPVTLHLTTAKWVNYTSERYTLTCYIHFDHLILCIAIPFPLKTLVSDLSPTLTILEDHENHGHHISKALHT